MLDCFSHVQIFATLWTVACQIPLSMGFHRQEFWTGKKKKKNSRLGCHSFPGDLPKLGIQPMSLCVSCIGRWVLYH